MIFCLNFYTISSDCVTRISLLAGDVCVNVTFTLTASNELEITYSALATKPTPINLTNHTYFNLGR